MTFRRLTKIFIVNISLLTIGIAALELYFGGWFDPRALDRMEIPREQVLSISVKHLYPHPTGNITYTRDHFGFRGDFITPHSIDLLTVGGSTTNQLFIDDAETWQLILERQLIAKDINLTIGNAGIDGQSTFGHLSNFKIWFPNVPGLKPKYILFYDGINDYLHTTDDATEIPLSTVESKDSESWKELLKKRSILWYAAKRLSGIYQVERLSLRHHPVNFATVKWIKRGRLKRHAEVAATACSGYAKRLRLLAEETRKFGATPIFVTQPSRHYRFVDSELQGVKRNFPFGEKNANGFDYYKIMREYDKTLMQVYKEVQGICIDPDKTIWEDQDFYDYVHMTPAGSKKLGELLANELQGKIR